MPTNPASSHPANWLPYAIIAALLCVLYYRVAVKLVYDWYTLPDYSQGFLVPLLRRFPVWDKRKVLSATPIKQTWAGIALVVFAIGVLILGVYGVELFTARMSFIFLLTGLVWTFFGWAMVRAAQLPASCPHPCDSIPGDRLQPDHLPAAAPGLENRQRHPAVARRSDAPRRQRHRLPIMKLEVAEACSGIRSLMSLFTLAVFYGYFLERDHEPSRHSGSRQHSDRSHRQRRPHRRHWPLRTVLGPGQGSRVLPRVPGLGHVCHLARPVSIWFTAPCGLSPR